MRVLGALRRAGVLGINRRNTQYTLRWNPRRFYPRVDDKLATKRLCAAAGIPIPKLYASVRHHFELEGLPSRLEGLASFVLKPARGAMGNGILVVLEREGDRLRRPGGRWIGMSDLVHHGGSIISGLYALGGQPDVALVEERLEVHPVMRELATEGVPDVRVIVHRGIPVMAMTRLPTQQSGGRANLHQGAVGAGIELSTGRIVHAILGSRSIREHPETGRAIRGFLLPDFDRILEIAVAATDETGLGYVGADVVVDAHQGPLILELNARPGLAIQLANRAGLLPRLREVEATWRPGLALAERIALGRHLSGVKPRELVA
jgi:alpha-L-glutamate ligase-like protein